MPLIEKTICSNYIDEPAQGKAAIFVDSDCKLKVKLNDGCVWSLSCENVPPPEPPYSCCDENTYVDVLIVGAGGAGGTSASTSYNGGGGGGGAILHCNHMLLQGTKYAICVNPGGIGTDGTNAMYCGAGCPGGYTRFCGCGFDYTVGGGEGGRNYQARSCTAGGRGGNLCLNLVTIQCGCPGGAAGNDIYFGGGGGSFYSAGSDGPACLCATRYGCSGSGGDGYISDISGTIQCYGGGGGGGTRNNTATYGGIPGVGGGVGAGLNTSCIDCLHAPCCGGGGGGGSRCSVVSCGGCGGHGVAIIRYKSNGTDGIVCATGGTIIYCNGYTIHTFGYIGTNCAQYFCIICSKPVYF